jgi:integrase
MPRYNYDINSLLFEEDIDRMFKIAKNDYERAAIAFLWVTGARPMEIIDLTKEKIIIREDKVIINIKTLKLGKSKKFSVNERQLEFDRLRGLDENKYIETIVKVTIMAPQESQILPYSKRWMEQVITRLGVKALDKPISPYHIRHSFYTWAARNGWTLDRLKQHKGAKDYKSVWGYLNAVPFVVQLQNLKREGGHTSTNQ